MYPLPLILHSQACCETDSGTWSRFPSRADNESDVFLRPASYPKRRALKELSEPLPARLLIDHLFSCHLETREVWGEARDGRDSRPVKPKGPLRTSDFPRLRPKLESPSPARELAKMHSLSTAQLRLLLRIPASLHLLSRWLTLFFITS